MKKVAGFSYLPYLTQYMTLFLVGFFLFVLGTISYEGYSIINPNHIVEAGTIDRNGGTLTVQNNYSEIKGLQVIVPHNAYPRDVELFVKEYNIDSYDLPHTVHPISPMIELEDNIDGYTSLPLMIKIPINVDASSTFVMGFYYNEDGTLEAIPVDDITDTTITLKSLQYKPFFLSSIGIDELDSLVSNGKSITTGFEPGEDDWPFANYGSSLEIRGHCAGQSISSMYYFLTQTKNGQEPLHTYADNDTPTFWLDDSDGIRYSTVIQNRISFTTPAFSSFTDDSLEAAYLSYYGFLYAMHVTGNPQFMAIYAHVNDIVFNGHGILAYKAEGNRIYVSDPNFPGGTDRYIEYNHSSGYGIYNSGDNASDISQFRTIEYDTFGFVGITSFVDFDILDEQYTKFEDGTIGQFLLPTLSATYEYNNEFDLVLDITIDSTTIIYTIFIDNELYQTNLSNIIAGSVQVVIPFEDLTGDIGILAEEVSGLKTYYADYLTIPDPTN